MVFPVTDPSALDSFLDKWRTRWPEWRVVGVFVPESQQLLAVAWFSLLQEFSDAMNIAGDPLPADAKLAWWGEELRDWQQQRSRHPLGRVLEPQRAPWFELAEALPVLQRLRGQPRDLAEALATVRSLAAAIAGVEAVLFGAQPSAEAEQAIQVQWLATRLQSAGAVAVPLQLPAGAAASQAAWSACLLRQWPLPKRAATARRLWLALAKARLQRFTTVEAGIAPLSPVAALWCGWRAARAR